MEFNQVESFVAVVQNKSFSKAAEVLYVSQPTVTSNVQKLESNLGLSLINRKTKNIALTKGGEIFYRYAIELINVCAKAEQSFNGYKDKMEGTLDVYASTIPEQYIVPYIIRDFRKEFPSVRFSVRHKDSEAVLEEILLGAINFGFVGAKSMSDNIEYIDFYNDRLVLIASPDKKVVKNPVSVESLVGENILLREEGSGTRQLLVNALKKRNLDLNIFGLQMTHESLETIKRLVILGEGISFISEIAVKREVESGELKQYEVQDLDFTRSFSLAYINNRCLSPLEEKFKAYICNWSKAPNLTY